MLDIFVKLDTDSVGDYIAQGAISVVLSDAIFDKEAMGRNNFNAIHQLAKSAALQGKIAVEWWAFYAVCSVLVLTFSSITCETALRSVDVPKSNMFAVMII